MLAPPPKTKRFFELIQVLLTFISVCAVAEASGVGDTPADGPGFHAATEQHNAARDRRFSDLARVERKRHEAEQHAHRRSAALAMVAGASAAEDGVRHACTTPASTTRRSEFPYLRTSSRFGDTVTGRDVPPKHEYQLVATELYVAYVLQPPARPVKLE